MAPLAPSAESLTRRRFLALSGILPAALIAQTLAGRALAAADQPVPVSIKKMNKYPIGLELYSVRDELARDLPGTLRRVSAMGYEVVEFYAPYCEWTVPYAKDVRRQLDDLGLRCYSTHNPISSFAPGAGMTKAIELNQILGTHHLILAMAPRETTGVEGWKTLCAQLTVAVGQLQPHGLTAGYHNHQAEWVKLDGGQRIMDVIAANTPAEFVLQFDVGTCLEAGADPVAWIKANPGRIRSVHLKDWAPGAVADEKAYRVLFGEGTAPWRDILAAVESVGGVEFYLLEQEGSRYSQFDTAQRCLDNWKSLRGKA